MKLIPKDALVVEIEKLINEIYAGRPFDCLSSEQQTALWYIKSIMSSVNTLEVKEVGNIWHDASETPKGAGDKEILVQFTDYHTSVLEIDDWEYLDHQTKWAYLKDLI